MIHCCRNREQKKRIGRVIIYSCCMILYTCRAHRQALVITAVEREEKRKMQRYYYLCCIVLIGQFLRKPYHVMEEHTKKENTEIYSQCRAVRSGTVYMPCRTHGNGTAVTSAPSEIEEEDVVVLLPFVQFPLDNTLFLAPTYNTDSNMT